MAFRAWFLLGYGRDGVGRVDQDRGVVWEVVDVDLGEVGVWIGGGNVSCVEDGGTVVDYVTVEAFMLELAQRADKD